MAINLDRALEVAYFSKDGQLIRELVDEVKRVERDNIRLASELAYTESLANRLQNHNTELVAAVVGASAEGLIRIDTSDGNN